MQDHVPAADCIDGALALGASSVGIAIGGGTEAALETVDAALMRERVLGATKLATRANSRQVVGVTVGLKAMFSGIKVAKFWAAIMANRRATALVTLNASYFSGWRFAVPEVC